MSDKRISVRGFAYHNGLFFEYRVTETDSEPEVVLWHWSDPDSPEEWSRCVYNSKTVGREPTDPAVRAAYEDAMKHYKIVITGGAERLARGGGDNTQAERAHPGAGGL